MKEPSYRSIPWIIIMRIFGLVFFLFLLFIANHMAFFTQNPLNYQIILFLNDNIWLIVIMSFTFLFGEVFNAIIFPFNLPAPLFNASGGVLLVTFLLRIFSLIDDILNENIFQIFDRIAFLIYPLVFLIVLIGGYISIFARSFNDGQEEKTDMGAEKKAGKVTWEDIGDEFRLAVYDLISHIRQSIKKGGSK